jgi:hypothetical protein
MAILESLTLLTRYFWVSVSATQLHVDVESRMMNNRNPWFEQNPQMEIISGTGDIWLTPVLQQW